jgi:hypothetical protein
MTTLGGCANIRHLFRLNWCRLDVEIEPKPFRLMRDSAGGLRDVSGWMSKCNKHEKRCISQWVLALCIARLFGQLGFKSRRGRQ